MKIESNINSLNSAEILILKDLMKSKSGVNAYTFHKERKLPPSTIINFVNKFQEFKLIILQEGNIIQLSVNGRNWVIANKKQIYLTPRNKYWRRLPNDKITAPLEGCYLPDEREIDFKFFQKLIR